jgi:drug/metabolite transporter (DMT)-like permease
VRSLISTVPGTKREAFGWQEWSLLSSLALIWGSSFLFIEIALRSLAPGAVAFLRLVLGAAVLALIPASRSRIPRDDWPRIALLGFTWLAFPMTLIPIAQQWITSSLSGMLNSSMPLFAAAIGTVLLRRLPGRRQIAGLMVGFIGVLAIGSPFLKARGSTAVGVLLVLVATASYGLSANLAVPLQQRYGAPAVLARVTLVAAVLALPLALVDLPRSTLGLDGLGAVAILGVLGTGLAIVMMATLVGRVGATRGSVAIYFLPVVAIILGVVILDESIHALTLVGTALVLLGAYVTSRREE